MICDLCDKDQQNICERTFHFVKPINECLMRKAQENKQIIEELEKIKEKISKLTIYHTTVSGHINLISDNAVYRIIDKEISELRGEQNAQ